MQSLRFLPIVLALGLVTGCNKTEVDAAPNDPMNSAGAAVKGTAAQASAAIDRLMQDLDLANLPKLDTAKLQELGKSAMSAVAAQLNTIKDLPSAKSVSGTVTPLLAKLEGLKTALGNNLPNVESVKSAISSLSAKFPSGEIMQAIEPMLTKLKSLVGAA